jgi:hypothetical protein
MTTTKTVTGKVVQTQRTGHTVYGNPIMTVSLYVAAIDNTEASSSSPVTFRISDNASLVYAITNTEFFDEPHTFALTRAGRISHVVK